MYGDTSRIRADAAQLREGAARLRAQASSMRGSVSALSWNSVAGRAFRIHADIVAGDLGMSASVVDETADQLVSHARAVDDINSEIEAAERAFGRRLDEAHAAVRSALGAVGDAVGDAARGVMHEITRLVPSRPLPGSPDWLSVKTLFLGNSW